MAFIYYSQGVSSQFQDFTERLMSHLALKGTEITRQDLKGTTAQMHVKHTDEQGYLEIAIENKNIKVTYTVDRERKEYAMIKPKITASQNMVEKAREALSESQNP
jgi:hypothetical protein